MDIQIKSDMHLQVYLSNISASVYMWSVRCSEVYQANSFCGSCGIEQRVLCGLYFEQQEIHHLAHAHNMMQVVGVDQTVQMLSRTFDD